MAATSDIVTDALTAFGLSAQDTGHFADVLAAASSNANTNVSMMGETFKYCAPIAGALGFSVEDTAVGTIMTIVPKVVGVIKAVKTAFLALNATMLANPIVLIIAAIAALVAAFIYLWNSCDEFRQFWIDLWESIKEMVAVWEGIKNTFTTVVNVIKTAVSTAFNAMWNGIKNTISGIYSTIKNGFANAVNFIKNLASSAFSWGADIINGIVNGIKSCMKNTLFL